MKFSIKLIIFVAFFVLAFVSGSQMGKTNASDLTRAYFRVKDNEAFSLISAFVRHQFGEGVYSIEAPRFVIERLAQNPKLEFRGEASLWKISSHRTSTLACSPSSQIPWGVAKVNGGNGGDGVKVAVVDTGVNINHVDLKANIVDCRDAQYSSLRKRCSDGNGHGTHVAGTIAANGKIKGVAPNAKIMAIKVCSNGGYCWSDDVARGIRYAADNGANIINVSLGGNSFALDEKLAIDHAVDTRGSLIIAAAGNSGPSDNTIGYPAAYSKVVAVGAIDSGNLVAGFSSRGNNYLTTPYFVEERDVELVGPGVSVESTARDGCYATYSGTSMATPHMVGLAAKLWQGTGTQTRTYLQELAKLVDLGRTGDDPDAGFGLPVSP